MAKGSVERIGQQGWEGAGREPPHCESVGVTCMPLWPGLVLGGVSWPSWLAQALGHMADLSELSARVPTVTSPFG